jgi:esterase
VEDDFAAIESVFTDVAFVAIEGAGHWVHAEKPTEFYNALRDFLA